MLTGYKIKGREIAVDTSSKISQRASNHFKPVTGNTFKDNKGQLKVLPNSDNTYYKSTENGYADYGSSTYGGKPDLILVAGTYYLKLSNTLDKVLLQCSTSYSGRDLTGTIYTVSTYKMYNSYFPHTIKIWIAMCGGGSGASYNNGKALFEDEYSYGGNAAGSCIFSWTFVLPDNLDSMYRIVVGKGGIGGCVIWRRQQHESDPVREVKAGPATSGGDSSFSVGYYKKGAWDFSTMFEATGGSTSINQSGTFSGSRQTSDDPKFNGYFVGAAGGVGGRGDATQNGGNASIQTTSFGCKNDYSNIYDMGYENIKINGGTGNSDSKRLNVGGGACAFFGSVAGTYDSNNGKLGSGGAASNNTQNAVEKFGGSGGDGACHIWVSGSNHYEIGDDISICVMVTQLVGAAAFVFPYDINNDQNIEITYTPNTGESEITLTKTARSWRLSLVNGQKVTINKAVVKSI